MRRIRSIVANVFLFIAAIIDLALAVLLIGIAGFLFGPGPESIHGSTLATAGYAGRRDRLLRGSGCRVSAAPPRKNHGRDADRMAATGRCARSARESAALLTPLNAGVA